MLSGQTELFFNMLPEYLIKDNYVITQDGKYYKMDKERLLAKMGYDMTYINSRLLKLRQLSLIDNFTKLHGGNSSVYIMEVKNG